MKAKCLLLPLGLVLLVAHTASAAPALSYMLVRLRLGKKPVTKWPTARKSKS